MADPIHHGFSLETSDEPAARAYRDGRLIGALLVVARAARVYVRARYPSAIARLTALHAALEDLAAAERACGVDLTSPTEADLQAKPPKRRKARR